MSLWQGQSFNCLVANGSYTGNDTVDRTILHGLGKTPSFVSISSYPGAWKWSIYGSRPTTLFILSATLDTVLEVASMDAQNFYVGDAYNYAYSANGNTVSYYWAAFA